MIGIREFLVQYSGFICLGVASVAFIISAIVNVQLRRTLQGIRDESRITERNKSGLSSNISDERVKYLRDLRETRKEYIKYLMDYVKNGTTSGAEGDINLPTMTKILDDCLARGWW